MTCLFPITLKNGLTVPCGRCFCCNRNLGNDWQLRLTHEAMQHKSSIHITLTYDNGHYPASDEVAKRDLQLFIKRVRFSLDKVAKRIRFFSVCERGSRTRRLHHHCIIFGANTYDAKLYIANQWTQGFTYTKSLAVRNMTQYVTNYVGTKYGVFRRMSQGIGKGYLTPEIVEYHRKSDNHFIVLPNTNGIKRRMPRYYRDKIWTKQEQINSRYEKTFDEMSTFYLLMKIRQIDLRKREISHDYMKKQYFYRKSKNELI